jgi:glycosyltransferase involved in cell wall biosynthesis
MTDSGGRAQPVRLLVAVTAFAVHPPRRGGQTRPAGLLANLGPGWRVEHWSQVIQRTDLPWPQRTHVVTPRWTEHRMLDPVSTGWHIVVGRLGYPPIGADRLLGLLPRRAVRRALARADAVYTSHPYQVPWVRAATPPGTPLVVDTPNVESQVYRSVATPLARRLTAAVARAERRAWEEADLALASTTADAAELRAGGVREVVVIPNAADVDQIQPVSDGARARARAGLGLPANGVTAIFIGSAHPPNIEAVELLERWASAHRAGGVLTLVVGRCGVGRSRVEGIVHAGEVPDVGPWLAAADIALSPLLSGGGSSLKVAQYMAAGLPVVATPVGARGLDLRDGIDAVIRPPDAFPDAVVALAGDAAARLRLGARARRVAEERFGWGAAGAAMAGALDALLERRA